MLNLIWYYRSTVQFHRYDNEIMAVQQNDYFGETYFEIFRDEMSRCLQLSNGTVKIYAERSQEIMKKK